MTILISNAIVLSALLLRQGRRDDVVLQLYHHLKVTGQPLGRPLALLLPGLPPDLQRDLARYILYSPTARWGQLGPRTPWNRQLAQDLAAFDGPGTYRARLTQFRAQHPRYFEPLSGRTRDELQRAIQMADQHGLVGFPVGRQSWGFLRVARALARLTGESKVRVDTLASCYLFHQVQMPLRCWTAMVDRYRERPDFMAWAPLLQVTHAWDKHPDLQLNLSSWGRLLGFDLQDGRWISRYAGSTNREIMPGFTLVKPARIVAGQPCPDHRDCFLAGRQHLSTMPHNFSSPVRISADGHLGVDLGSVVVRTEHLKSLDGCFSARTWHAAQLIDWTAGDLRRGDRPDPGFLVVPFHPDAWARGYPEPELFPSAHDRAKTFHRIMDENPVTKPPIDRLIKKPHDRARTFRRTMQASYRLDRMAPWINQDFKFKAQGLQYSQQDIDLMARALQDPGAADQLAATFGPVRRGQDRRATSAPSQEQKRWDRLVQLPLSAALATVSRKLLGGRLSTFLPGTCPWLSGASNLWDALGPRFSAANLDVKNCFPSLDHRNPEIPRMIDETRALLASLQLADEGRCIAETCHYYLGLLRRARYQFDHPVEGQIPSGFVLTPLLWYSLILPACLATEQAVQRRDIKTWDLAGDDLMVIAGPDPTDLVKRQVLAPWFETARRLNLQFHFWKNYRVKVVDWRTDPTTVVPPDHGQSYRSAWVDRFPVGRLPLYHAGVAFYRRQIVVVSRMAGEQLDLLERAQVRASMLAKHLRRSKEDAGSTLAPLVLIRAVQAPEMSSSQLSRSRTLDPEESNLTPREGAEDGPSSAGDSWKRLIEALAQGSLGHAGRMVGKLTVRPRVPGWTAASTPLTAVDIDDVSMFLAAEPTIERARRAQFDGRPPALNGLAIDRYRRLVKDRRWKEAAQLVIDRWIVCQGDLPPDDLRLARRFWCDGRALLPIEAELALHLPVRFPRTSATLDRARRYGEGGWSEAILDSIHSLEVRRALRWMPLVWYYRETGFRSEAAQRLIDGKDPLAAWVSPRPSGRAAHVGTWQLESSLPGNRDWWSGYVEAVVGPRPQGQSLESLDLQHLLVVQRAARWKLARLSPRMVEDLARIGRGTDVTKDRVETIEILERTTGLIRARRAALQAADLAVLQTTQAVTSVALQTTQAADRSIALQTTQAADRSIALQTTQTALSPDTSEDSKQASLALDSLDPFLHPGHPATINLDGFYLSRPAPVGLVSFRPVPPRTSAAACQALEAPLGQGTLDDLDPLDHLDGRLQDLVSASDRGLPGQTTTKMGLDREDRSD